MFRMMVSTIALAAFAASGPAQAIGVQATQQSSQVVAASAPVLQAQDNGTTASRSSSLLGGIFGCSADGSSQTLGAAIGGVAGGFLGNRIAGSGSRTLGTVIGAALGAAAGSAIGCKLQKTDRERAERAAQAAVETGTSQTWTNADTGASGSVVVTSPATTGGLADLRFASGVEPAASFVKIGDSYTTRSAANLRSSPTTTGTVRATLPAGQRLWVPAQVKGQPWMLVAENGVGQGYVSSTLLTRTTTVASSNCKLVTQSVSVPGEAEQAESYQACKGSDGQWTMTKV